MSLSYKDFKKVRKNEYKCFECGDLYGKNGITSHYWLNHTEEGKKHGEKTGDHNKFKREDGEIWNKGKKLKDKQEVLCENSDSTSRYVRDYIIKKGLLDYKCEKCANEGNWQGEDLTLHLDHINGDRNDQRLCNLRFLCPNCHSQTETYCGKKKDLQYNQNTKKVSDDKLKEALDTNYNIRQALLDVGLDARGGNYERCKRLLRNTDVSLKERKQTKSKCVECDEEVSRGAKRCHDCESERRRDQNTKIDWPSTEWLVEMRDKYSLLALSRRLGVSANGIKKRIRKH